MGTPVDYSGIRQQLKSILAGDLGTSGARLYVETEPDLGMADANTAIAIFSLGRSAAPSQPAAFGKQTIYHLRMSLWAFAFNLDGYEQACEKRDTLLGALELVLMKERTIGGKVATSWLEGGEIFCARHPQSNIYVAAADTILVAEVRAVNT